MFANTIFSCFHLSWTHCLLSALFRGIFRDRDGKILKVGPAPVTKDQNFEPNLISTKMIFNMQNSSLKFDHMLIIGSS